MPRAPRKIVADTCYHVLNRGNDKRRIFHKQHDFAAFTEILAQGLSKYEVELFSWCLMPNHWHLVLRPTKEHSLSELMRWVTVTHVRRYYQHYDDRTGHLYQGRFKAFPVEEDRYFLTLCRYVEANPKRAQLVEHAQDWQWSSLSQRATGVKIPPLAAWPVDRPTGWTATVNEVPGEAELGDVRASVNRSSPFGSDKWARRVAASSGSIQSLRPLGRPPKPLDQLSPRQRRRRKLIEEAGQKGVTSHSVRVIGGQNGK